jgi:HSP20 family protein
MPSLPVLRRQRGEPARAPARWDPWRELEEMHDRMGRLFDDSFAGLPDLGAVAWSPAVDVEETDDAWLVEAELPGVKRGDVTVEVRDGELAIHGELKERERKGILRRRTRRTGRFHYRLALPGEIDPDTVDASLEEGVLTVRVPKGERARPRRVEIKGADGPPQPSTDHSGGTMTTQSIDALERSNHKTNEWLSELAAELGTEDKQVAYRVLRGFFHVLRDRLTVEEAAQLAAQLPQFLRGVFDEGWRPAKAPQTYRDREAFLDLLAERSELAGKTEASVASRGLCAGAPRPRE